MFSFLFWRRRRNEGYYRRLTQQTDIRETLRQSGAYIVIALFLNTVAMMQFENLSFADSLWLTLVTVTTVGYSDIAPATLPGRITIIVLLFMGGIFVLFHIAADYFDYRLDRKLRMLSGRWRWHMANHILILNSPKINAENYFVHLIREFQEHPQYQDHAFLLLSHMYPEGLPEKLQDSGLVHYHGRTTDPEDLISCDADNADVILVLVEQAEDNHSDVQAFDILHRLRDMNCRATYLLSA